MAHRPCIHEYFWWPEYEHRLGRQVEVSPWFSLLKNYLLKVLSQILNCLEFYSWITRKCAMPTESLGLSNQTCTFMHLYTYFFNMSEVDKNMVVWKLLRSLTCRFSSATAFNLVTWSLRASLSVSMICNLRSPSSTDCCDDCLESNSIVILLKQWLPVHAVWQAWLPCLTFRKLFCQMQLPHLIYSTINLYWVPQRLRDWRCKAGLVFPVNWCLKF